MHYKDIIDKITVLTVKYTPLKWHGFLSLVKAYLFKGYGSLFYSTDGVDALLQIKLKNIKKIFYVDIGANHPFWSSNTLVFYKNGGSGINIEPTPGLIKLFNWVRRRDINIEAAVSNNPKDKNFYIFDYSAYNTFSERVYKEISSQYRINKIITLKPKKLSNILEENLPENQTIHLLSVDVEGHDLEVLKSNNWKKYKPQYIVVEQIYDSIVQLQKNTIYKYLMKRNYKLISFTGMNSIYESNDIILDPN